ncbi:MAG TPA: zinc finger domain-containing protein [archaeon]|nr:zinc finger domain-containing protein [archaeon]
MFVMKCLSCGVSVDVDKACVEFPCPSCGKEKIVRCSKCKRLVNKYKCPGCGSAGP